MKVDKIDSIIEKAAILKRDLSVTPFLPYIMFNCGDNIYSSLQTCRETLMNGIKSLISCKECARDIKLAPKLVPGVEGLTPLETHAYEHILKGYPNIDLTLRIPYVRGSTIAGVRRYLEDLRKVFQLSLKVYSALLGRKERIKLRKATKCLIPQDSKAASVFISRYGTSSRYFIKADICSSLSFSAHDPEAVVRNYIDYGLYKLAANAQTSQCFIGECSDDTAFQTEVLHSCREGLSVSIPILRLDGKQLEGISLIEFHMAFGLVRNIFLILLAMIGPFATCHGGYEFGRSSVKYRNIDGLSEAISTGHDCRYLASKYFWDLDTRDQSFYVSGLNNQEYARMARSGEIFSNFLEPGKWQLGCGDIPAYHNLRPLFVTKKFKKVQ